MTGALIITNLTRNDQSAKSILLDKRQPDKKLIEQLKNFSIELENKLELMTDEQAKAAHGILGALRNLSVPSKNIILIFYYFFFRKIFLFSYESTFISGA